MRGRIQALPAGKNFGFLVGDGEEFRRFFSASAVDHNPVPFDDLEVDDLVQFEPEMEAGQQRAKAVRLLAKDNGDVNPPIEEEEEII